jgi:hypothetical protein
MQSDDSDKEGENRPGEEQVLPLKCGSGQIFGKENSKSNMSSKIMTVPYMLATFQPKILSLGHCYLKLEQRISTFLSCYKQINYHAMYSTCTLLQLFFLVT